MKYRNSPDLPEDKICLTDGGLETVLVFEHGIDLPEFASFTLFKREDGEQLFRDYLQPYIDLAVELKSAFQLVDCGWRANPAWGQKLGMNQNQLETVIRDSIGLMKSLREENETPDSPMPIIGCIGPRGDGYIPGEMMTAAEATEYHHTQIGILSDTVADAVTAMTLSYPGEAIGIIEAARACHMPVTISFTVETDGRLPNGEPLAEAIDKCDSETGDYATGYMINCAHPTHFAETFRGGGDWINRIRGIRANASTMSHEELDQSETLDRGTPQNLASEMAELLDVAPGIQIIGGCCGTDFEHIREIAAAVLEKKRK
ncbi:MAG: homocysteine S-methyltransferase family protein [Verrucomicrobiales bacterium]|nr:homocysteine S-methyltransferase family protein [Verrucomicrobiales bacterium]